MKYVNCILPKTLRFTCILNVLSSIPNFFFLILKAVILKDSCFDQVCTWECAMFNLNSRQDKPLTFETGCNEKNILVKK